MGIYRPKNINRRLVGAGVTGGGSTGNGGQIGGIKLPVAGPIPMQLGQRCTGGASAGVFRITESFCGVKNCCRCGVSDCKGNVFCISGGKNWFVPPLCAETSSYGTAASCANSVLGSLGWFEPTPTVMSSAYSCNQYWQGFNGAVRYQANSTQTHPGYRQWVVPPGGYQHSNQYGSARSRAFRCADV